MPINKTKNILKSHATHCPIDILADCRDLAIKIVVIVRARRRATGWLSTALTREPKTHVSLKIRKCLLEVSAEATLLLQSLREDFVFADVVIRNATASKFHRLKR